MPRYIVQRDYQSHAARWNAGLVVELGAEEAAWFNRDSRGVLKEIIPVPPEPPACPLACGQAQADDRAVEAPPRDRMVRKGSRRGKR
jgi:hypothetical protein